MRDKYDVINSNHVIFVHGSTSRIYKKTDLKTLSGPWNTKIVYNYFYIKNVTDFSYFKLMIILHHYIKLGWKTAEIKSVLLRNLYLFNNLK